MRAAELFQDEMLLQRQKPVKIWGTAMPGQRIDARIQGKQADALTDENGRWEITLPPLEASLEESLILSSGQETLVIKHVAVGEVWAACGQSNMEFPLGYEKNRETALDGITDPAMIRFYDVPKIAFDGQQEAFDYSAVGFWRTATAEDIPWFSAIGFYFAKELQTALQVPVGIIGCNWGGTRSAVWMREDSVERVGAPWMDAYRKASEGIDWDAYFERQKQNPANAHGSVLNPGNDMMLPVTISMEEFEKATGVGGEVLAESVNDLMPEKIPGSLYHHMVEKLAPYTLRGILWYQGESDDELPGAQSLYGSMLQALIGDWRRVWQDEELPFLVMQLANFKKWLCFENRDFAAIRRGQEWAAERTANTWLCANTDAGEEWDIHPKDKKTPAHRLALLARGHIYGEALLCDAPKAAALTAENGALVIPFDSAPDGLVLKPAGNPSALRVFCGEHELPYRAAVQGNRLILRTDESFSMPVTVKYALDQWFVGSIYNTAGLPAFPFELTLA